jgi:Conserved hypothetical protein (DUF2461)
MSQQTMTANGYFGPGLFRFLRDLKTHNERGWFEANKQRYKADVQAPLLRLITDLAPAIKEIGGGFIADPSPNGGSMMRIYRDIRFSKDKSPYKTHAAAHSIVEKLSARTPHRTAIAGTARTASTAVTTERVRSNIAIVVAQPAAASTESAAYPPTSQTA